MSDLVPLEGDPAGEPAGDESWVEVWEGPGSTPSSTLGEAYSAALAPVKGFGVTFRTMFDQVNTEQYPEERKQTAPRFHGRHQLNRHPDGLEKCVGCELCAWACPADAIFVEGADNTPEERYSPGERYGKTYQINYTRCIFCGLCIEACPTRALTMTNEFELADPSRENLIFTKANLLAPLEPGMEQPPHPQRLGEEPDYFTGPHTYGQHGDNSHEIAPLPKGTMADGPAKRAGKKGDE